VQSVCIGLVDAILIIMMMMMMMMMITTKMTLFNQQL